MYLYQTLSSIFGDIMNTVEYRYFNKWLNDISNELGTFISELGKLNNPKYWKVRKKLLKIKQELDLIATELMLIER